MFIHDKRFRGFVLVLAVLIVLTLLESGRRHRKRRTVPRASQSVIQTEPNAGSPFSKTGGFSMIPEPNDSHVQVILLEDDGTFPNNAQVPLLIYQQALPAVENGIIASDCVLATLETHEWGNAWSNGVYPYHHYHSTAHEVLFICQGQAKIQFGGPQGPVHRVNAGDVVVIPAGVAHKRLDTGSDLTVVGAYPKGQTYDMCLGTPGERPQADRNIANVPLPVQDPVYGPEGPLMTYWHCESRSP